LIFVGVTSLDQCVMITGPLTHTVGGGIVLLFGVCCGQSSLSVCRRL